MRITATTLGCDSGMSGIGRYTSSLLTAWSASPHHLDVYGHDDDKTAFLPQQSRFDWHGVHSGWKSPIQSILWHQLRLPALCRSSDVLFLPAGNRRLPVFCDTPKVATVHDCSSMHVSGKYDRARDTYIKQVLPRLMRSLDHIITVSESTRADLVQLCGVDVDRISVIPLAADADLFSPQDPRQAFETLAEVYNIRGPFLLYTARIEHPGKNHVRLMEAWETLRRIHKIPHQLVFVGPEKERSEIVRKAASRIEFVEDVLFVGAVPAEHLPLFYAAADIFVFPSLYEGFGLPILESLSCGTPVACSDRSSLPEVGGNCVSLFDPDDPVSIASTVFALLTESNSVRKVRIDAGLARSASFTWQRTADDTMAVLERIARCGPATVTPVCGTLVDSPAPYAVNLEP